MGRQPERTGIQTRVGKDGKERYRGTAYDKRAGKALRGRWTQNLSEARSWRIDALARIDRGELSGDRGMKLDEAVDEFLEGINDGSIRNRSGRRYKPSVVRDYERDLRRRLAGRLGKGTYLRDVRLSDLQVVADRLRADGLSGSSVRNTMTALRALYRWARPRGYAAINPCDGLQLPLDDARVRERIASPEDAALLVGALTGRDRTAFALAVYAGLRAGELLALDWDRIDLAGGVLRVERAWDHGGHQFVPPKSKAAERVVPIIGRLGAVLADHADQFGSDGLLLPAIRGDDKTAPMSYQGLTQRLSKRWMAAGLEPLGLHEGRHTFASLAIEAMTRGRAVNPKALCSVMGHSSITVTYDRYGHLLPGTEVEIGGLLDTYLEAR